MDADESAPDHRAAERVRLAGGSGRRVDALQRRRSLFKWKWASALLVMGSYSARQSGRAGRFQGGGYGYIPFGGQIQEERAFGGYTIPSKVGVGWRLGTDRYFELFRARIENAVFR